MQKDEEERTNEMEKATKEINQDIRLQAGREVYTEIIDRD